MEISLEQSHSLFDRDVEELCPTGIWTLHSRMAKVRKWFLSENPRRISVLHSTDDELREIQEEEYGEWV
jgi:hypothetical protein